MKVNPKELKATLAPTTPDSQYDLAQALNLVLDCIPAVSLDPHAAPEARDAARYLYERIINYRVMLRNRPLTKSIEFLTPARDMGNPGWYYKVPTSSETKPCNASHQAKALKTFHQPAFNWKGPFSSYREALAARDAHLPRTKADLMDQQIMDALQAIEESSDA